MPTPALPLHTIPVAVDAPFHSGIGHLLSYASDLALPPGTIVRVPLGAKEVTGIVWRQTAASTAAMQASPTAGQLRPVGYALAGIAPLGDAWMQLMEFTARYYQRSLGEVALAALPAPLRTLNPEQIARKLKRLQTQRDKLHKQPKTAAAANHATDTASAVDAANTATATPDTPNISNTRHHLLTAEQSAALAAITQSCGVFLLHGVTGSGKTEVYMRHAEHLLTQDAQAQILFLVPEINLTPQLQALLEQRFAPLLGAQCVASLHSGLTPAQRFDHWLATHQGHNRIVLGTRMAIMSSMPHLRLIVVDEEHDPSYKQQEGARYHARDLAVWRGRQEGATVILGSATPSLESWHNSRAPQTDDATDAGGPYTRIPMPQRVGEGALAALRVVDMRQQPAGQILAPALLRAMQERLAQGQQCMILLNRRGYAPVIRCQNCDWKSDCPHCSAHQVLHMSDRSLRCHYCGFSTALPRHCPNCHSKELLPIGQGTEQLQQAVQEQLRHLQLPSRNGTGPARAPIVMRMDADSTRHKGALEAQLEQIHNGEVDIIVGTQMIAKGHDFRRVGLIAAIQPDGALYSSDFRAPERLFALLMQAAGRAGRDADYVRRSASSPELWLQTREPAHPLYQALRAHDFAGFARQQLQERQRAGMPPYIHQALLRADARTQEGAQAFLQDASAQAHALLQAMPATQATPNAPTVTLYPPIPLTIQRIANVERAQVLLESPSRAALQRLLHALHPQLHQLRNKRYGLVRWIVDVDPIAV